MRKWIALIGTALVPVVSPAAWAQTTLSYGTYLPDIHTINIEGIKPLGERLSKESGGKITIQLLSGGTAAKATGAIDSIRDGLVSAGKITDTSVPKQVPHSYLVTQLALLGQDPLIMGPASNEYNLIACKGCKDDAARNGIIPMAYYSTTPHVLICKEPVDNLAQLKGMKIRASGAYAIMYRAFGAVPVNLPHEESFEAFARNQIGCADSVDAWLRSLSLWDAAKHVVDIDIGTYHGGVAWAMNAGLWKGLPADQKEIIKRNIPILVADIIFGYLRERNDVRKQAEPKGVTFKSPDATFQKAVADYRAVEIKRVRELGKSYGIKDSDELIDTFLALIEKWRKINAEEVKGDKQRLVAALNREIYSKVQW